METLEDLEDIIEYCPQSPEDIVKIVYVCSLCCGQYSLVDDLRGHMMEYHKYQPVSNRPPNMATSGRIKDALWKNTDVGKTKSVTISKAGAAKVQTTDEVVAPRVESEPELRPAPFKDFRMILRSKMTQRCPVSYSCAYKFEDAARLALHVRCHRRSEEGLQFKCYECGLEAVNWRNCSVHLWKTHGADVDMLRCPICSYKAHASVLVWRHMRVHKKWRSRVLRSLRAVHQRRQQNMHKLSQVKSKPVVPSKNRYYAEKTCEICKRKFVNGKTLSKHVKTVHNKIKPFICNVCGLKTARKASLIIHMRQHTGEKPLQCKGCKFATRDPSVLHKHQSRHEKTGKLKCEFCEYSCIQTNAYKRHMRLNHSEEYSKIACDLCSYVTISAEKLQAHKEDHRNGLVVNNEDSMEATRSDGFKNPRKMHDKNNEISADCFLPLESIDSMPHEPAVDTGGVTIPAPSEDTQFPTYLNN